MSTRRAIIWRCFASRVYFSAAPPPSSYCGVGRQLLLLLLHLLSLQLQVLLPLLLLLPQQCCLRLRLLKPCSVGCMRRLCSHDALVGESVWRLVADNDILSLPPQVPYNGSNDMRWFCPLFCQLGWIPSHHQTICSSHGTLQELVSVREAASRDALRANRIRSSTENLWWEENVAYTLRGRAYHAWRGRCSNGNVVLSGCLNCRRDKL